VGVLKKPCSFCKGNIDSLAIELGVTDALTCPVCKGAKVNTFRVNRTQKLELCKDCEGTGGYFVQAANGVKIKVPCTSCSGKGWRIV